MGQKIQLSESQLRNLIKESVKKSINEISDTTAVNAMERSKNLVDGLDKIGELFEELEYAFDGMVSYEGQKLSPASKELKDIQYGLNRLYDRFKKFQARKTGQYDNFEDEYIGRGRPDVN